MSAVTGSAESPLEDLVVIEAGSMISVPNAGRLLADFGATVIKIEHPEFGDRIRGFGPQKDGTSVWGKYLNRNKLCVTLDLKRERGQEVFLDLLEDADVLLENFRPETLERWGLGSDALREAYPALIVLRLSGFGQTGPDADRPGFGTLAEAMSGFAEVNGFPDKPPLLPPTGFADQIAGLYGVIGVMFALYHRDVSSGTGQVVDVSLIESALNVLGPQLLRYDQTGEMERRTGNRSTSSAPRNVYRTKDDRWVALSASTEPLAMRVFEAIDRPDLKTDPRFETNADRLEHGDELNEIISEWMAAHTREEILDVFEAADATIAPVYNTADILADEHYRARDSFVSMSDSDFGECTVQNVFPKLEGTPSKVNHLGPNSGAHNDLVYGDLLGYDVETVEALAEEAVI